MEVIIDNVKYEIVNNYEDGLIVDELVGKITDYYDDYTYIVGDWAYGKVRLKGFYDSDDKRCNKYNNIDDLEDYLKNNCAYGCKWFEIKKIID